jgi:glycosyltransferase involved in cell wall biosynthesis
VTTHDDRGRHVPPKPGYLIVVPWSLDALGGVTQVVRNLYRELDSSGWAPAILVTTWAAATPRDEATDGIAVIRWRVRLPLELKRPLRGFIAYVATLPATVRTWRRLARHHGWQVVNFHFPGNSVLTWIVMKHLRLWQGLIVLSVHGRDVRDPMHSSNLLRRLLLRVMLEQADAVVACSPELSREIAAFAPRARDRITVILNGVSTDLATRSIRERSPDEVSSGRRFILNVATFEHKKSQDVLIEAFSMLAPEFADVDLIMAGRSTPWLEVLKSVVHARGLDDRVRFLCNVPHEEIAGLLSRASVFCLPSRAEGHPVALLEAGAFGLPVVATTVGGIPETVVHQTHGLLVPAEDAAALSEALSRLLTDRGLGETLGGSLQRRIAAEFTWERTARLYSELMKQHGLMPQPGQLRPERR